MRLRLHHRIVLPFAAVAIVATSAVAWVALRVTSTSLAAHIRQDVISTAAYVSRGEVAMNPAILSAIKQVSGADVLTFDASGVMVTTLGGPNRDEILKRVMAGAAGLQIPQRDTATVELGGNPSVFVAYHAVMDRPGVTVALLHENTEVEDANRMLMRTILGTAALSLLFMIFVSQLVARRVTAPLAALAAFAQDQSTSRSNRRAEVGDDEVGRLGAAFNEMLDRIEAAQASLVKSEKLSVAGLFAARVAHDVRNPLSSIKMQTQLLHASQPAGSEEREMTEAMLHDIDQVEFVVKGLLDVARPGVMHRKPQVVTKLLETVIRQVAPQCRHRHITLHTSLAADLPVMEIDADKLTQALLNVLVNACEAVREGGTVQVISELINHGGDVRVIVDDDGVGLDTETLARVFDPFVTTKPGGVGLGLVNARAAVESHGGTIELTPREPIGTRVTISLPVTRTDGWHG